MHGLKEGRNEKHMGGQRRKQNYIPLGKRERKAKTTTSSTLDEEAAFRSFHLYHVAAASLPTTGQASKVPEQAYPHTLPKADKHLPAKAYQASAADTLVQASIAPWCQTHHPKPYPL